MLQVFCEISTLLKTAESELSLFLLILFSLTHHERVFLFLSWGVGLIEIKAKNYYVDMVFYSENSFATERSCQQHLFPMDVKGNYVVQKYENRTTIISPIKSKIYEVGCM